MLQKVSCILWPSFLVAAAETVFFALFDPGDLMLFGESLNLSSTAVYSIGFFLFWTFTALSSGLTSLLERSSAEVNR